MLKSFSSMCLNKLKTTTAKVTGGVVGAGSVLSLIFMLHADLKADMKDAFKLSEKNATLKVAAINTKVESNQAQAQIQFKAVQNTIDLQVQTINQKMKAFQAGQTQVLKVLNKLDQRLYDNLNNNGG